MLLKALVSGLPVLVTDVCGYAHYIAEADAGRCCRSPVRAGQSQPPARGNAGGRSGARRLVAQWPGLRRDHADLYSMPQRAADLILGEAS